MPDYVTAFYLAACSVRDGDVAETEMSWQESFEDRTVTLMVTLRREVQPLVVTNDND